MDKIKELIFIIFLVIFTVMCFVGIYNFVSANGEVEYCYINRNDVSKPCLWGSVDWRIDNKVVCSENIDKLVEHTKKTKCPLNAPKTKEGK